MIKTDRASSIRKKEIFVKRRNRPRRFHCLVEILRDRCTPVVCLSGEPPSDPKTIECPTGYRLQPDLRRQRNAPNVCKICLRHKPGTVLFRGVDASLLATVGEFVSRDVTNSSTAMSPRMNSLDCFTDLVYRYYNYSRLVLSL